MANANNESGPVQTTASKIKNILGKLWWVFPAIVLAISFSSPDLRGYVKDGITPNLPWWMIAQIVGIVGWVGVGFMNVTNSSTPVSALKMDAAISNLLQLSLVSLFVYEISLNQLQWGVIIPTVGTILDVFVTNDRAINNAAQKPIVQQQQVGA